MTTESTTGDTTTESSGLKALIERYRGLMAALTAVSFVGALLEAGFLVLITAVGMALVGGRDTVGPVLGLSLKMDAALAVAAVALVFRLAFNLIGVAVSSHLTARVTAEQRTTLAHAYLGTSWAIQQREPSGRLQELLTSFVARVTNTVSTLTNAITAGLSLVAFLGAALVVDPLSTVAVVVALGVVALVMIPFRRLIRSKAGENARAGLEFANAVSELGSLGQEMQTFGVQQRFTSVIDDLTEETTSTQRRVQTLTGSLSPVYMALAYAAVLAGIALLAVFHFGNLSVVGAVMLLMLRSLSYGQQLASASGSLASNAPFLDRIAETVRTYRDAPATSGPMRPKSATPITASDVGFGYTPDRPALSNVSFELHGGEIVGIIGPSGAGKSTLAQLLIGLRDPTEGSLQVDGIDLREVDRGWWHNRVAFVAQEPRLFTGTVAENIRFFRDGIDEEALRWAASEANLLKDIESLPEGFDTHLGERGGQLSGGQRQRLSIARALAGRPEIIILDEPTSALDGQSEALIRDTLGRLKGHSTVVVIAHRMSTLDVCDRIMVIESGRMAAFDHPHVLSRDNDFYKSAQSVATSRESVHGPRPADGQKGHL